MENTLAALAGHICQEDVTRTKGVPVTVEHLGLILKASGADAG